MWWATHGGKARQLAAKGGMVFISEPVRARLKDVRTRPSKALSAHLFFVASCRSLRRTSVVRFPSDVGLKASYTGPRCS